MFARGGFGNDASIGPEPASSNPFQVSSIRGDGTGADRYAALDVGPSTVGGAGSLLTVWAIYRLIFATNRTYYASEDPALAAADGGFFLDTDGGVSSHWGVALTGPAFVASGLETVNTVYDGGKIWTDVMVVRSGTSIERYLNGNLDSTVATALNLIATAAGNRLSVLIRPNLAAGSAVPVGGGLVGFGGASNVAVSAANILAWHEACVDQYAPAPMAGETHRWDARDSGGANWACRVSGQLLVRTGAPTLVQGVPVYR